jgi:uncharacterized protein
MKFLRSVLAVLVAAVVCATGFVRLADAQTRPEARPDTRQEDATSTSFVAQFPDGDVYRVQVIGDAFAEGLAPVLADVLQTEQRLQVNRKHRAIGALVRADWEEEIKIEEASRETPHIVVLMAGLSDKQLIRFQGTSRTLSIGSDEWKEEYARRFERLLRAVKKRNTALYVIGQPILSSSRQNTTAEILTDLMRQRSAAVGAKFIDIYETFQDDSGGYSQFGPDVSGNRVKLRDGDGVTLTTLGQRKLALVVERDIKRDLSQAASDRTIPLAGDEAEQKRISPAKATGARVAVPGAVAGARAVPSQVPVAPAGENVGDQKSDNGRVTLRVVNAAGREETATIDIVRPAIPAAVIALLTRRESAGERAQQPGEGVVEDVGSGLTVVNSVSSLGESGGQAAGKRRVPLVQSAFYQVLIKGERMTPKAGRADDFSWPRKDPFVAPPAPVQPASSQPAAPARAQTGTARTVSPPPAKSSTRN